MTSGESQYQLPHYQHLLWPTLQAVIALGGSASIAEVNAGVAELENLTEEAQGILHGDGPKTELEYRLAWARTYLKGMGLLTNSERGVWSVTEAGEKAAAEDIPRMHSEYRDAMSARRPERPRRRRRNSSASNLDDDIDRAEIDAEANWKDILLDTLLAMSPGAFEKLAQRLLRESGFSSATVTGRSGDGGIDGVGVYQVSLLSFPVFFQCKRYKGSVGPSAVRDFRGAMAGRGEKGLLITTGTFSAEARAEAKRDGAPPIDLIDGDRLCELLKENKLGTHTTTRTVEEVTVEADFFASLEPRHPPPPELIIEVEMS